MPPVVNVEVQRKGSSTGLIADPIDDDGLWSPKAKLNKNAGRYYVYVSKTASTAVCNSDDGSSSDDDDDSNCTLTATDMEIYTVKFACKNASGAILSPREVIQTQNQ
jgi:hypothetical protein